jgi:Transcription factor WhiB
MRPTSPQSPPPCAAEPQLWFDKSHTHALGECLGCPMRRWCAGEAIRVKASFGMWAGVFIDDNLPQVVPLLRAIAHAPAVGEAEVPHLTPPSPAPTATAIADRPRRMPAVLAAVSARSSGNCEIMTNYCRLTFDTLGSRVPGRDPWSLQRASDVYAVCRPCAVALDAAEPQFVERQGIVVRAPYEPAYTRFFWRQARWVYLDGGPRILPTEDFAVRKAL